MLASRPPGILPPLTVEESIEVSKVHSATGEGNGALIKERAALPGAAPHHISTSGLAGGASNPRPAPGDTARLLGDGRALARGRARPPRGWTILVEAYDHDLLLETILPYRVSRPTNVLQPYCNRADTGRYTMDKVTPPDDRKPHR
jgi:hypothetical protein